MENERDEAVDLSGAVPVYAGELAAVRGAGRERGQHCPERMDLRRDHTGSFPVTCGGCYTVAASDRAGNTGRDSITVYGLVDGDRTVLKVAENGVYGALPALTAEGYRFDGWYTAAEGGAEVKTGAEIGSNYTVYARWTHIAHAGGTATCQKRAVCAVCGAEYGDLSGHAPAAQWSKDESGHWHACQTEGCTEKCDFAVHLPDHPGGATEEYAVLCTVCGYVIQPQLSHTHNFNQEKAEEAEGVRQRSCQNDPQHIDRQNIPKLPARPVGPKPAEKPQETPGSGFVDVPEESYFREAVDWAVKNGITTGVDAAHFAPDGICTRAQAVTFLWRAAGCPAPQTEDMPFADVTPEAYYYRAVLWAVEHGVTKGTGATAFSPDAACTRGEIVTFIWRSRGSAA